MARAISVRLDEEVQRALAMLEAVGLSRSAAIRKAILDAAAVTKRRAVVRAEVQALESNADDRAEMRATASIMEGLRAPW